MFVKYIKLYCYLCIIYLIIISLVVVDQVINISFSMTEAVHIEHKILHKSKESRGDTSKYN